MPSMHSLVPPGSTYGCRPVEWCASAALPPQLCKRRGHAPPNSRKPGPLPAIAPHSWRQPYTEGARSRGATGPPHACLHHTCMRASPLTSPATSPRPLPGLPHARALVDTGEALPLEPGALGCLQLRVQPRVAADELGGRRGGVRGGGAGEHQSNAQPMHPPCCWGPRF